jgi:large subunit ribosomal protein L3
MKLPGHMGSVRRTAKNLEVLEIDVDNNLVFVKGAVPGANGGLLRIVNKKAGLGERYKKEARKKGTETNGKA